MLKAPVIPKSKKSASPKTVFVTGAFNPGYASEADDIFIRYLNGVSPLACVYSPYPTLLAFSPTELTNAKAAGYIAPPSRRG